MEQASTPKAVALSALLALCIMPLGGLIAMMPTPRADRQDLLERLFGASLYLGMFYVAAAMVIIALHTMAGKRISVGTRTSILTTCAAIFGTLGAATLGRLILGW